MPKKNPVLSIVIPVLYLSSPAQFQIPILIFYALAFLLHLQATGLRLRFNFLPFLPFLLLIPLTILVSISILAGNPGALGLTRTLVLSLALFLFIPSLCLNRLSQSSITTAITFSALAIFLITVFHILFGSAYNIFDFRDGIASDTLLGRAITYAGTKSLFYIVPFLAVFLAQSMYSKNCHVRTSRFYPLSWHAFLASLLLLLFSGEGTSIFVFVISLLLLLLFLNYSTLQGLLKFKISLPSFLLLIVLLLFSCTLLFSWSFLFNDTFSRMAFSSTNSDDAIRYTQLIDLFRDIQSNFFWGAGLGYDNQLGRGNGGWESELSFISLFAQLGLIGFTSLASIFLYPTVRVAKAFTFSKRDRSSDILRVSHLVAVSVYLICSFFNPFILSSGHTIILFLPVFFPSLMEA